MSVNGISFEHYCKLAQLIEKNITVITDNDGKSKIKKEKFKQYEKYVKLCMEENDELNTLEPSFLEANKDKFKEFRKIVYLGKDINKCDDKKLLDFMKKNKTDWSLRVFEYKNENKIIVYPKYILKAISKDDKDK